MFQQQLDSFSVSSHARAMKRKQGSMQLVDISSSIEQLLNVILAVADLPPAYCTNEPVGEIVGLLDVLQYVPHWTLTADYIETVQNKEILISDFFSQNKNHI